MLPSCYHLAKWLCWNVSSQENQAEIQVLNKGDVPLLLYTFDIATEVVYSYAVWCYSGGEMNNRQKKEDHQIQMVSIFVGFLSLW